MKAIVIYYSLEGNTHYAAEKIAFNLGADTLRLESEKNYPSGKFSKYVWGGKSVVFGDKPKLKPYSFDAAGYDTVIIGTPVWASTFAPPIKTFIAENYLKGKTIGLFACHGGGSTEKCFQKLKAELAVQDNVPTLSLQDPAKRQSDADNISIQHFCNKFLTK